MSNAKGPPCCHAANKRKLQIEALDRIRADPERNAERLAAQRSYYWREGKQRGVETRRLRVYAMSPEAYAELFTRQKGLCAICHKPERCRARGSMEPRALAVDHDHKTGKCRGLLCNDCNRLVAILEDDSARWLRAAAYLGWEIK